MQTNKDDFGDQNKGNDTNGRNFDIILNNVAYHINASPFPFNDQIRYNVSVNSGNENIFVWDSNLGLFRPLNDKSSVLPVELINEISENLQGIPK